MYHLIFVWFGVLGVEIESLNELSWPKTQKLFSATAWRATRHTSELVDGCQQSDGETVMISIRNFSYRSSQRWRVMKGLVKSWVTVVTQMTTWPSQLSKIIFEQSVQFLIMFSSVIDVWLLFRGIWCIVSLFNLFF